MKTLRPLTRLFDRFRKDEDGYITIEALIVLPALLWLFAAGWVYFDAFRQQSVNQKANYVIGDMLSRETAAIDNDYINNAHSLLQELNKSTGTDDSSLRVTVVSYDHDSSSWGIEWSAQGGDVASLTNDNIDDYIDRLPDGLAGDQLILVETWDFYDPVFEVGLGAFEITTYSFTRPRYAPQVVFENT